MKNPKCPYCGDEMEYYWDNNPMMPQGWFFCPKCHSQAPTAKTEREARAAAMKRDRAKGEWINEDVDWVCSICGHDAYTEGDYRQVRTNFCPDCGAYMRKETNNEGA